MMHSRVDDFFDLMLVTATCLLTVPVHVTKINEDQVVVLLDGQGHGKQV